MAFCRSREVGRHVVDHEPEDVGLLGPDRVGEDAKGAAREEELAHDGDQGLPEVRKFRIPSDNSFFRRARYWAEISRALAWSASS